MYTYNAKLKRVVDGDTIDLVVDLGLHITTTIRIRLKGIDTPETYRPRNDAEKQHGLEAKAFVEQQITGKTLTIQTTKTGKYGRWIADIRYLNETAFVSLTEELKAAGFEKKEEYPSADH